MDNNPRNDDDDALKVFKGLGAGALLGLLIWAPILIWWVYG